KKISEGMRGNGYEFFLEQIKGLPEKQLWRHNQAGDLAGENCEIDEGLFHDLIEANRGRRGFTYTHKPLTKKNVKLLQSANENGFTVNVSCDSFRELDNVRKLGLPAVVVVPENSPL
ncbi:hypothetical protein RZS08_43150, partial [Arthrospira platensis SPKY1]|nr:hypothetical protein [Arthrospira platensis SPKY1]